MEHSSIIKKIKDSSRAISNVFNRGVKPSIKNNVIMRKIIIIHYNTFDKVPHIKLKSYL